MSRHRAVLSALIVVNVMVLLGQVWPAGAPPFARVVNIGFLIASLGYFLRAITDSGSRPPAAR